MDDICVGSHSTVHRLKLVWEPFYVWYKLKVTVGTPCIVVEICLVDGVNFLYHIQNTPIEKNFVRIHSTVDGLLGLELCSDPFNCPWIIWIRVTFRSIQLSMDYLD